MNRTLSLKREALAELSADDLLAVAGAALPTGADNCLNTQFVCWTEEAGGSRCLCPTEV